MRFLYETAIRFYGLLLHLAAFAGNNKAKLWIAGRKEWRNRLKSALGNERRWIWFHCASLGEFEQGRPLLESIRKLYPAHKVLLTFFSPSGYEIRKNYSGADVISYLPLDTASNAKEFVDMVDPEKVFFIKYEFWFNYLIALNNRKIAVYFVSCIFRKGQWLFSPFAKSFRKELQGVTHFFVQDKQSQLLLNQVGINQTTISGDTRFDRVLSIAETTSDIESIMVWKGETQLIVAGSTWDKDDMLLLEFMKNNDKEYKLVLVPHIIEAVAINRLRKRLEEYSLSYCTSFHSASPDTVPASTRIYVIDKIGLLSRLYRHATVAYIGGGFGAGIHNTLEAAVYGLPVLFGPNYKKFKEARDLIKEGAALSINSASSIAAGIDGFVSNPDHYKKTCDAARDYVYRNKGATGRILKNL